MNLSISSGEPESEKEWSDARLLLAKVAILWCVGSGIFTLLMVLVMIVLLIGRVIG